MANLTGGFIWYELMSPDPAAAKRFYDAVVGWDIESRSSMPGMDYRMIKRSDGGNAGGVFPLTPKMIEGGSRVASSNHRGTCRVMLRHLGSTVGPMKTS